MFLVILFNIIILPPEPAGVHIQHPLKLMSLHSLLARKALFNQFYLSLYQYSYLWRDSVSTDMLVFFFFFLNESCSSLIADRILFSTESPHTTSDTQMPFRAAGWQLQTLLEAAQLPGKLDQHIQFKGMCLWTRILPRVRKLYSAYKKPHVIMWWHQVCQRCLCTTGAAAAEQDRQVWFGISHWWRGWGPVIHISCSATAKKQQHLADITQHLLGLSSSVTFVQGDT